MSNSITFIEMIESYMEDKKDVLQKNTIQNYKALKHKLFVFGQSTGFSQNIFDYDIFGITDPMVRNERIKAFTAFWNAFIASLQNEYKLTVTTRNQYRQILHAIVKYAESQYGTVIKIPSAEKQVKYKDRKRELPQEVVNYLFNLSPSHHWAVNLAKLALYTCWRVGDLLKIEADDITEGEFLGEKCYYITRTTGKTKKPMKTPVPIALIKNMMRRNAVSPGDKLVKFAENTMHGLPRKLTDKMITEQIRSLFNSTQYLRDQKIQAINAEGKIITLPLWKIQRPMHLLRSAGASYLIANGLTPEAVAKWFTGHENSQVLSNHYVTTENFMGAKELFRDRFAATHIKNADKAMKIFDNEGEEEE